MRLATTLGLAGLAAIAVAQQDSAEKSARAVLDTKCAACHGPAQMSGLDVRDRALLLKGGKRGPAIVPGKADDSLLYKAVRRDGELQMPPGKTALTAAEVGRDSRLDQRGREVHGTAKAARHRGGRSRSR